MIPMAFYMIARLVPRPSHADRRAVLRAPAGAAYDTLVQLEPPFMSSPAIPDPGGAFGLLTTPQQRWRVYVLPIHQGGIVSYVEALTPLGRLDASIQAFRIILPVLGLTSVAAALLLSWAIAGRALRPVARMTQTAQTITLSQDLTRRIEMPTHQDELGRLVVCAYLDGWSCYHRAARRARVQRAQVLGREHATPPTSPTGSCRGRARSPRRGTARSTRNSRCRS